MRAEQPLVSRACRSDRFNHCNCSLCVPWRRLAQLHCMASLSLLPVHPRDFAACVRVATDRGSGGPAACDMFRVSFRGAVLLAKVRDLESADLEQTSAELRLRRLLRHQNLLPLLTAFLHGPSLWSISPYCDLLSAGQLCQPFGLRELPICLVIRDVLRALQVRSGG